jgi:hypothetical protein
MSYNSELQNNNDELQNILNAINDLPDASNSVSSDVYIGSDPVPSGTKVQIDPNAEGEFTIPEVLQTTGTSEVDTMSQKAITEALQNIVGMVLEALPVAEEASF